jgi:hypothetical protein
VLGEIVDAAVSLSEEQVSMRSIDNELVEVCNRQRSRGRRLGRPGADRRRGARPGRGAGLGLYRYQAERPGQP